MSWAVIGAGYTGIAVAAAMLEAGLEVDVLDARTGVGGLWRDAVYDDLTLITTRRTTAYDGRPLPPGGQFPSGAELLAYLEQVAQQTGVLDRLRGSREVREVVRDGDAWTVDGESYEGVVLATGMFTDPRVPDLPGTTTATTLHTSAYKNVSQLGDDVLVVGLGNSGADVAQACVRAGKRVTMAVRRPRHVVPKRVLGMAVVEMRRPAFVPDLPVRAVLDVAVRAGSLWWRRGRLGEADHLLLSESPVVHSAILPLVAKGSVAVAPGVTALEGDRVRFSDGSTGAFDTIVWATGYTHRLPVERALLDGRTDSYATRSLSLVGGAWSPVSRGLAAVGHREPRNGRGPYFSALGRLVAAGALAQPSLPEPVGAVLARTAGPTDGWLVDDARELRRLARLTEQAQQLV